MVEVLSRIYCSPPPPPLSLQEQYVFIHDALVEAVQCGETEVAVTHLHRYVDQLLSPQPDGRTALEHHFQVS